MKLCFRKLPDWMSRVACYGLLVVSFQSAAAENMVGGGAAAALANNPAVAAYLGGAAAAQAPSGLAPATISNTHQIDAFKAATPAEGPSNPPPQQFATDERVVNEFQVFIQQSIGQKLPIFGADLFKGGVSTFAPIDNVPVTPDYLIGPGDEVVLKGWGTIDIDFTAVVNRNGEIDLPKVGSISVAGVRYAELQRYLKKSIGKVFRNFELNVTLGKLRSIQVFVVGHARRPGVYTVSSLSTLVNTLFATGGPSASGSMRQIEVKRNGKSITQIDLYELLLKGDKTKDVSLLPGDIIYIPPVGAQVAIYGGVKNSAIFELKGGKAKLSDMIELAGGLSTTAAGEKVLLERIDGRIVRKVEEVELNLSGLGKELKDGDLVQVFSIGARFDNAVTLRGNVAAPGRYPWKNGMRVGDLVPSMEALIIPEYWVKQNTASQRIESSEKLKNDIKRSVSEINWDYAVIERLNTDELSTMLIPFNLARAIAGDAQHNMQLLPGDMITVFSKDDMQVPLANRSVFVKLEGEIVGAGVYKALPGETLRQLLKRVGGFTSNAYLYGAEFNRESVRQMQQKKMDEMLDRMEESVRRNSLSKQQESLTAADAAVSKAQADAQLTLISKMRTVKASGRLVLEVSLNNSSSIDELPDLPLEDGDRFFVPAKPDVVSVMGMVYNENSFIYRSGKSVGDYLAQAGGPTRDADADRIYLIRADGSVLSAQNQCFLFFYCSIKGERAQPGDAIVVPETLDRIVWTKELKDWTQIFYQFAMGVSSLKVLGVVR